MMIHVTAKAILWATHATEGLPSLRGDRKRLTQLESLLHFIKKLNEVHYLFVTFK